jgi:glycosyltransferase involved in cell wall biosynthesis
MVSIFIRTYYKDLKWLEYCLKSIHKNLKGWDEIVVCIPASQKDNLKNLTAERVVTCKKYKDDYLGQQVSKLQAHEHCNGDFILFVDSDVVFYEGAHVDDYFKDGKPVILKDKYENVGEAICWKPITEKLFGKEIKYEYMRRAPQLYCKSSLVKINKRFPELERYIVGQPFRAFSEFNALGFFIESSTEAKKYEFIDLSNEEAPITRSKQFWSWSGLTTSERKELEQL